MNIQVQKQGMKIACVAFAILSMATVANAQRVVTGGVPASGVNEDFTRKANAAPGVKDGSVRVVDNKGTVKYLQTANGLTTITNTTANVTTTTWQLGGVLTDDTYIDATGKVFALDGIKVTTAAASKSGEAFDTHGQAGAAGYTFLVHNEITGATEKLLAADMVVGGNEIFTVDAAKIATPEFTMTLAAANTFPAASFFKYAVYRNGVKLAGFAGAGADYTATTAGVVTLVPSTTADADWALYVGDKIEINWIK